MSKHSEILQPKDSEKYSTGEKTATSTKGAEKAECSHASEWN